MHLPETWLGIMALLVLTAATMGGMMTAILLLADKGAPFDLGLVHGRAGVVGILLLVIILFMGVEPGLFVNYALGTFIMTVIGGATLYYLIRRKGILSKTVVFAHGSFAAASMAILLFGLPI